MGFGQIWASLLRVWLRMPPTDIHHHPPHYHHIGMIYEPSLNIDLFYSYGFYCIIYTEMVVGCEVSLWKIFNVVQFSVFVFSPNVTISCNIL